MAMNKDARKIKRSLGFRFVYLVILLTALATNGGDGILKADDYIGGSRQTLHEEILQSFPNWDTPKLPHPKPMMPIIVGWSMTEFELRLMGPRTEQADITFLIYAMIRWGREPTLGLVSEYRYRIHFYYENYRNPLSSADEEKVSAVRETLLRLKSLEPVRNGKVACINDNAEHFRRLEKYRIFLNECPHDPSNLSGDEKMRTGNFESAPEVYAEAKTPKEPIEQLVDISRDREREQLIGLVIVSFVLLAFCYYIIIKKREERILWEHFLIDNEKREQELISQNFLPQNLSRKQLLKNFKKMRLEQEERKAWLEEARRPKLSEYDSLCRKRAEEEKRASEFNSSFARDTTSWPPKDPPSTFAGGPP